MYEPYWIILLFAVVCSIFSLVSKPRKMKLSIKKQHTYIFEVLKTINRAINKNKNLYEKKEEYITKLTMINHKEKEKNNVMILLYILISFVATTAICAALMRILTMWFVVVVIGIALFYMVIYVGVMYVKINIIKIQRQFGQALECFVDQYITEKNIKAAINKSYKKMPEEIGYAFEMLARELMSGREYKEPILRFARNLSYIWGYNFAEILIMSYEGTGDVSEDLLFLQNLVGEEITAEEESKTSMLGNKLVFIIVNIATLIALIINIMLSDMGYQLYFYTPLGNKFLIAWLFSLIAGFSIIAFIEKG